MQESSQHQKAFLGSGGMNYRARFVFSGLLGLAGGFLSVHPALAADQILTVPDGRKVVLKDDGTWRYQDAAVVADKGKTAANDLPGPQADLVLERKIERNTSCRIVVSLTNNLPYEIQQFIPYFSAYRANGVLQETLSMAFQSVRPTDKMERSVDFSRIACADIARIQVVGGDRCEMGDLFKFSEANGQCLTRVRAVPSDVVKFEK